MKAWHFTSYGFDHLKLRDVTTPDPQPDEVRVRIICTAINDYDWSMVRGRPVLYQLLFGIGKPRHNIPGMELSGMVDAVGSDVVDFKVGDAVYGDTSEFGFGTFAEYICVNPRALVRKPAGMSFEEAVTVSHASQLAMQGLLDIGQISEGMLVLINGAGGGVGTFGLQIARLYNCKVTGVDTGEKLRMMEELGFDRVIDYKETDFTRTGDTYDLILDAKTTRTPRAYNRALKPRGTYATVGGTTWGLLRMATTGWAFKSGGRAQKIVALQPNKDLDKVNTWYNEGKIQCIIDGPYPMEQIPELITYFGQGKHSGKVVVTVQPE